MGLPKSFTESGPNPNNASSTSDGGDDRLSPENLLRSDGEPADEISSVRIAKARPPREYAVPISSVKGGKNGLAALSPLQKIIVADACVPLPDLLTSLGHPFQRIPGSIRCPVHSGGGETGPSAKIYSDNHIFCFACGKQYGVTEIAAARFGVSRADAARQLLTEVAVSEEQVQQALEDATLPEGDERHQRIRGLFDRQLLRYRRRVPLAIYSGWAKAATEAVSVVAGMDDEDSAVALRYFGEKLYREFVAATTPVEGVSNSTAQGA